MECVEASENGRNRRISLHGTDHDIGIAKILEGIIKSCISCVGIVCGAVAHKDQNLIFRESFPVFHESMDGVLDIISTGQKRRAETDRIKMTGVSEHILLHQIVFDTVDDMGRLNDQFSDAIAGSSASIASFTV